MRPPVRVPRTRKADDAMLWEKRSTKLTAVILAGVMTLMLGACGDSASPDVTDAPGEDEPDQLPPPADGVWFAFIQAGGPGSDGQIVIDPAEMLTGDEAHDAAVDAGVIGEDEDLPNDFFILNPDDEMYLVGFSPSAEISVLPAMDLESPLTVSGADLVSILTGSYAGDEIYGVVAGEPAAFEVTVSGGVVTEAEQVYLP